jgi:hypothetical protein
VFPNVEFVRGDVDALTYVLLHEATHRQRWIKINTGTDDRRSRLSR